MGHEYRLIISHDPCDRINDFQLKELIDARPEQGSQYIRSTTEPFDDEMELSENRAINWLSTPPPGAPGPFSLADTNLLKERFKQAGFQDIAIETGKMSFKLPSPEGYVDFVRSTAAPLTAMMAELPVARQEEIWNKVIDASKKFASADGKPSFTNGVIYVSAMK